MAKSRQHISIGGVVIVTAAGMASLGFSIAWLFLSPKSVLRSPDAAFVNGFGAGVAVALGMIFGVAMLGFAWSQAARRLGRKAGPKGVALVASALVLGSATGGLVAAQNAAPMTTRDFEFVSGNKKLSGFIDQPAVGQARALIMFIHGSGGTDIRRENRYSDLRRRFTELGIACVTWDKPGMGRSEGRFDSDQSPEDSAQEVLDAVAYLRKEKVPGLNKIGLWATSSGCWTAPIALSKDRGITFWISVSGLPAEDNKYYLMESNLPLEKHTAEETRLLMEEWKRGRQTFLQGGDYDAYLAATGTLRTNPVVLYLAGDLTGSRNAYEAEQKAYMNAKDKYQFDEATLSMVRVQNFDQMLRRLDINVLALFGEKDTNVNWRKARVLYESTIGRNPNATLAIRTFPDGNHNINVSKTGSVREVEGMPLEAGEKCRDYYESQIDWLRKYVVPEAR